MKSSSHISRRKAFGAFLSPLKRFTESLSEIGTAQESAPESLEQTPQVAVIQGRFCLAYQRSFCTTCSERCPETGAIVVEKGIPRVVAEACTGCGICHSVCPAPRNAILIMKKPELH
jgi:Na+-translocating ferredoxin:NAD+ oxidoreductase RNF subunit RnfB